MSHGSWKRSHSMIARKILAGKKRSRTDLALPQLPDNLLEWTEKARPTVEGRQRSFVPFPYWEEIYRDAHPFKIITGGRQTYKSTYLTDILAFEATRRPNVQVAYVTFNQSSRLAFARQKLMVGTLSQNPLLGAFPRNGRGNAGEISLRNGSTIYCTIPGENYRNIEGKSLDHCILDEAQFQPMGEASRVIQTMMATKGKLTITGIGGQSGSAYEEFWERSDQREWVFDDPEWRKKLEFDESGLVMGDYLGEITKGRWVPKRPENTTCHGYHIPQTLFCTIPLTIKDAESKYRTLAHFSIEHQQKNETNSFFATNVLGEFFVSDSRPVTREMVLESMTPYRYMGFSRPDEVEELKSLYRNKVRIGMGVDFGSGSPSSTVIAIMIQWTLSDEQKRFHLAYLEKRPSENQLDQAWYIYSLFKKYDCDMGVGDLGYGAIQVKTIQDGGTHRTRGTPFPGVGSDKFIGCRTISDESKPLQVFDETTDEHGDRSARLNIDKTSSILGLIDILSSKVHHPRMPEVKSTKLMVPSEREDHVNYLVRDLTSITRKDLLGRGDLDPRQRTRMEFNHPKDSVMAIIYALKALEVDRRWAYISV